MVQSARWDVADEAGARRFLARRGLMDDMESCILQTRYQMRRPEIIPNGNRDIIKRTRHNQLL